jgi:shikimate kinase
VQPAGLVPGPDITETEEGRTFAPVTVVLCGPVCAGKTTLSEALARELGASTVVARDAIAQTTGGGALTRSELVRVGELLEAERPGVWLADAVAERAGASGSAIVDSARTRAQISALRRRPGVVVVVHVTASLDEREKRFAARSASDPNEGALRDIRATPIEQEAEALETWCDIGVDTTSASPSKCVASIAMHVRRAAGV